MSRDDEEAYARWRREWPGRLRGAVRGYGAAGRARLEEHVASVEGALERLDGGASDERASDLEALEVALLALRDGLDDRAFDPAAAPGPNGIGRVFRPAHEGAARRATDPILEEARRHVAAATARRAAAVRYGVAAVRETRAVVVIGAGNGVRAGETGGWSSQVVDRIRMPGRHARGPDGRWRYVHGEWPITGEGADFVRNVARWAREQRAGNCGEQAAVAFEFLRANARGVRISYVESPLHVFVVLDRGTNPFRRRYRTYPPDAVVVDPWGGFVALKRQLEPGARKTEIWRAPGSRYVHEARELIERADATVIHETDV